MNQRLRSIAVINGLLLLLLGAPRAAAQTTSSDVAEALFEEGRRLFREGHYSEACAKFAESQRLEPAGGTLINLALCHEKEGKVATALREYKEAESQATLDARLDRQKEAREHMAALEPRLSRLVIVPAKTSPPGFELRLDGVLLGAEVNNVPLPVDPGPHRLEARAPGRRSWSLAIAVREGEPRRVPVPLLEPDTPPPPSAPAGDERPSNVIPWIVGGAGIVVLGIGTVFGVGAISQHEESGCSGSSCPDTHAAALNDEARSRAWAANISVGVGVGAVLVACYLLLHEN